MLDSIAVRSYNRYIKQRQRAGRKTKMKLQTGEIYRYNHMAVMFEYMLNNGRAAVQTFDADGNTVYLTINPSAIRNA